MKQIYENYYVYDHSQADNAVQLTDQCMGTIAFNNGATITNLIFDTVGDNYYCRIDGLSCCGTKISAAAELPKSFPHLVTRSVWWNSLSSFIHKALDPIVIEKDKELLSYKLYKERNEIPSGPPTGQILRDSPYFNLAHIYPSTNKLQIDRHGIEYLTQRLRIDIEYFDELFEDEYSVWQIGKITNSNNGVLFFVNSLSKNDPRYQTPRPIPNEDTEEVDTDNIPSEEDDNVEEEVDTNNIPSEEDNDIEEEMDTQVPQAPPPTQVFSSQDFRYPATHGDVIHTTLRYMILPKDIEEFLDEVIARENLVWE